MNLRLDAAQLFCAPDARHYITDYFSAHRHPAVGHFRVWFHEGLAALLADVERECGFFGQPHPAGSESCS